MRRRPFLRIRRVSPALLLLTAAIPPLPPVFVQAVDPRVTADDDFARHRDASDWRGLSVQRVTFRDTLPAYAGAMLADLGARPRAIVALHTNAIGFDGARSTCGGGGGSGDISVRLCSERYHPRASKARRWPFDDDDTLALIPYVPGAPPVAAFCGTALLRADANVVFERVVTSDGSLSNYAVQHGLRYVNLETADHGNDARGVAPARARLVRMADMVMERCGEVRGAVIRGR